MSGSYFFDLSNDNLLKETYLRYLKAIRNKYCDARVTTVELNEIATYKPHLFQALDYYLISFDGETLGEFFKRGGQFALYELYEAEIQWFEQEV